MRTALVLLVMLVVTPIGVTRVLVASLAGVRDRENGVYRRVLRGWARAVCWAAGARVYTHGMERLANAGPRVLVANHLSWFDVFALAAALPRVWFIAKKEMKSYPFFGRAMTAAGHLFVDRNNRKAAFVAYDEAAQRIREGTTVVIFPEGTRGFDYRLRQFKKGPFVLAIAAGVPVTPILLHGTLDVMRKGSFRIRSHDIHVHVLDDIQTTGATYDDRERIARDAHDAMARAQQESYGVGDAVSPVSGPTSQVSGPRSQVSF